jgi:hypothetical protein
MAGVSIWEERMSERAQVRIRVEREHLAREQEAEYAAEVAARAEIDRPKFEAGPPGGCMACYIWSDWHPYTPGSDWWHIFIDEEPWLCRCECHGGETPCYPPYAIA